MTTVGDIVSTVGGVQYHGGYHDKCGDILSTMGVFSTVGDIMRTMGVILSTMEDVQYREGYHDVCGGYHEYRGGVQYRGGNHSLKFEYRGDIMSTVGVFSTVLK